MLFTFSQLDELKKAYGSGENLTSIIKHWGIDLNHEVISLLYELQSGSYTSYSESHPENLFKFCNEIVFTLSKYHNPDMTLLDCGTGEGTTLIPLLEKLSFRSVLAIDASYSRLTWAADNLKKRSLSVKLAVADIKAIPLQDNSVDCALTIHALEPNRGLEIELLKELSRVSREYIFLIEPDYGIASTEQRNRMDSLGYVNNLDTAIVSSDFNLIEKVPILNNQNLQNQASIFVLKKERNRHDSSAMQENLNWADPIFNEELVAFQLGGLCNRIGLWFPELNRIPFLKTSDAQFVLNPRLQ
jgi:SAM-dependent methyltransferase